MLEEKDGKFFLYNMSLSLSRFFILLVLKIDSLF